MTLDQIQKVVNEIITKYNILFSECSYERKEGKIKFVYLLLKFKVDTEEGKKEN